MRQTHRQSIAYARNGIATMMIAYICMLAGGTQQCFGQPPADLPVFKKQVLSQDYVSEGVAVGDVNNDGKPDILAGGYWFKAPEWTRHEIIPRAIYSKDDEYTHSFINHSMDVNLDGWIDLVVVNFPGTEAVWFENPGEKGGAWKKHLIYETVGNESPTFVDIDGDGREDMLCADSKTRQMIWLKAPDKGSNAWKKFVISEKNAPGTDVFSHGLGWGDINGDGRPDVIITDGWWEGPENPSKASLWKFHPAKLGESCSQMYVLDVNNDGLADVVSASAHLSGIWWYEQSKNEKGEVRWLPRVISYAFAESHALGLADINGDGHPDLVTGKRGLRRSSWKNNPGTHGPSVLYWYELTPGKHPYWIAHQIDDHSGAGLNLVARDINGDGTTDIITANVNGVFLFENGKK